MSPFTFARSTAPSRYWRFTRPEEPTPAPPLPKPLTARRAGKVSLALFAGVAEPAHDVLDGREGDHEERELNDGAELRPAVQVIDDRPDDPWRDDGHERRDGDEDESDDEPKGALADVMEEGGASGAHSVTSLIGRPPRVDLPPTQTPPTITAATTNTGATPHTSAIGPTSTSGRRLKTEMSMFRTPNTRPRMSSRSSSCRSVIEGTVTNE